MLLFRGVFPVEIRKICNDFDFFRLEAGEITLPYEVIGMCLMGIV